MYAPEKLKKTVKIGCRRRGSFRPVATLGISNDGGIWIAPVAVRDQNWLYGTSSHDRAPAPDSIVETANRPKLHYHRSGIASITLSGAELERRRMQLPEVNAIDFGQILSLTVVRPWELAEDNSTNSRHVRISSMHASWPMAEAWTFQILRYRGPLADRPAEANSLPKPMRLVPGDYSRWLIDLGGYIPGAVLIARAAGVYTRISREYIEPSITISALQWSADRSVTDSDGVLALWSSGARNPGVAHATREQLLSEVELAEYMQTEAPYFIENFDEATDRVYASPQGSTRRDTHAELTHPLDRVRRRISKF